MGTVTMESTRPGGDMALVVASIDGVEFDDAWSRCLSIDVDGLALEVIGRDDLIRNEVAADRPQDRADVARLTQPESAD